MKNRGRVVSVCVDIEYILWALHTEIVGISVEKRVDSGASFEDKLWGIRIGIQDAISREVCANGKGRV